MSFCGDDKTKIEFLKNNLNECDLCDAYAVFELLGHIDESEQWESNKKALDSIRFALIEKGLLMDSKTKEKDLALIDLQFRT